MHFQTVAVRVVPLLAVLTMAGCRAPPCGGGLTRCGPYCVDLQTNGKQCGACGNYCDSTQVCVSGTCVLDCPTPQIGCNGVCVDPQTDPAWCGATGTCSAASAGSVCTAEQVCSNGLCLRDCTPHPLDLDTPLATGLPAWIASVPGQQAPTAFWGTLPAPRPTNTAWQQMVVGSGQGRADFLPYQVRNEPTWLAISNAAPVSSSTDVTVPDLVQIRMGANEFGGATTHAVQSHDLLSVTIRYGVTGASMTAPLVQGMPYVTADYVGLRPMLLPGAFTFTRINSTSIGVGTAGSTPAGSHFEVGLGDGSSWVVYTTSPIILDWNSGAMTARTTFTGTMRLANYTTVAGLAVLDGHASVVPRGGSLDVSISCDEATLRFSYATSGIGSGALLMAALPHHMSRLVTPVTTGLAFTTLSGLLTGVEGSTWTMRLPLSTIGWTAPRSMAASHVEAVRAALAVDASYTPDALAVANDPYFGGKFLAKLARLALIADELGETTTAATLRDRLRPLVAAWLEGTNANPLVYDTTWGGVVTTDSLASPGAFFGSGHYNDHHFHYGYHLYAAAVLAKAEPAFFTNHRAALLALVRDIANPSTADPDFPRFRHMDFFRGHSWASGLAEFPDIPDQESTSEAVNAWYGLRLLGQSAGDTRMSDLGRLLLALEIDAAQTYWQIPATSTIYPATFAQNRCVGRLFATRANFGTWFSDGTGGDAFKVYGIQMLPFTPVSEALISPAWVTDAWPMMQPAAEAATGVWAGWKGLLYMVRATTDREAAWTTVTSMTAVEDGNSRTNTLWWVATRP
jgi:endo-1,3(4)-beta-glucanase